jgi:hypothetical protein
MHLHPASLLLTAAVLLPNLLLLPLPPRHAEKYGRSRDPLALTIIERMGQVSCFILPVFFPLSFAGAWTLAGWILMAASLGFYYAGWARFLAGDRDYALLFAPMLGLPVPMAISPVIYFLSASLVLGSVYQAIGEALLGVGHIAISIHERRRIKARVAAGGSG